MENGGVAEPKVARTPMEIQRAHDHLHAWVTGELPFLGSAQSMAVTKASLDVLCWLLGHNDNQHFETLCLKLEFVAKEMGYELVEGPPPEEPA